MARKLTRFPDLPPTPETLPEHIGPLVAAVVLNYNSPEDAIACVDCIRRSTYDNVRLLVIDNASGDDSQQRLSAHLQDHEFLQLERNTGYAGGNNIGIAKVLDEGAAFVFILNPDIRIPPDGIRQYVRSLKKWADIGVLSPYQLASAAGPIDDKFATSVLSSHARIRRTSEATAPVGDEIAEVTHVLGAAMLVRAEVFRNVGGFDPLFFAYGEEEDFCRRVRRRGFGIGVTDKEAVVHLRTNEQNRVPDRVLFLRTKGAYLLDLKDPAIRLPRAVFRVFRRACTDLLLPRRNRYPFNLYAVGRRHVLASILWMIIHLPAVALHRRVEAGPAPYLDLQHARANRWRTSS